MSSSLHLRDPRGKSCLLEWRAADRSSRMRVGKLHAHYAHLRSLPIPPSKRGDVSLFQVSLDEVAACPTCRGGLAWENTSVTCRVCTQIYARAETGAPVLLVGDAPILEDAWYPGSLRSVPARLGGFAKRHQQHLAPDLVYRSPRLRGLVTRFASSFPETATIANVGSGTLRYGPNVVNIDIEPLPGVDIVGSPTAPTRECFV